MFAVLSCPCSEYLELEAHDRTTIESWHKLLAILAVVSDRTAVLPLRA